MTGLDEFVGSNPPKQRRSLSRWMQERPIVMADVERGIGVNNYSAVVVWKWLRTEHGLPYGYSTFTVWWCGHCWSLS